MTATSIRARPQRWLGFMFAVAALLCPLTLVLPHSSGYDNLGIAVVAVVGIVVAAVLLRSRRTLPAALIHGTVALGSLLTAAIIAFTNGLPNSASLFLIWVVL